jgi:hypothetical protein
VTDLINQDVRQSARARWRTRRLRPQLQPVANAEERLEVLLPWVADRSLAAGFGEDIEAFLAAGHTGTGRSCDVS